jgi:hypothetical protein
MLPCCPFVGAETSDTSQLLGVHLNDSVENDPRTKPISHVAAVQSLISVPLHEVHAFTDGSDALQHPLNGENVAPSQDTIGYPLNPVAHDLRSPLTVVAEMTTSYPTTPAVVGYSFTSGAHSGSHLLGVFKQLDEYIADVVAVDTSHGPPCDNR